MIKILDLCSGTQSVKIAYPKCDYKGLDIYQPDNNDNIIFDLSQDNIIEKIKNLLGNWKPDFIWASPLCTPFSRATCIPGGSLSYELKNDRCVIRDNFEIIKHKAYLKHVTNLDFQKKHKDKGVLGLKLLGNIKEIISYYNVPFVIENPSTALSKYELTCYSRNITAYCMYGFLYKKSTAIYSNKVLNLKKCNHKNHIQVMSGWTKKTGIENAPSSNKDRSKVPPKLIKEIISQFN